ncbi:MAG TPA: hypothetical protein VGN69_07405 [Solirubrobacteraceae bacterium]|nr:hypothetical protein [Solirubrobacteraceae bacterium]
MTRSPFLDSGERRRERVLRRRRRRARRRLLAAVILAIALGVLMTLTHPLAGGRGGARPAGPSRPPSSRAVSAPSKASPAPPASALAPGPSAPPVAGQAPLSLKLTGIHDAVHVHFKHVPRAGIMVNLDTGRVLWRHREIRPVPIASLTKMMTALLVVQTAPPDAPVLITREALAYEGSGVGILPRGRRVQLETLLNGLLLPSGNDAAIALAQHVAGSVGAFIALMNQRAVQMGLRCTRFASVDGFNDAGRSCAADLAVLARADLDQPRVARIARRRRAVMPLPIRGGKVYLYNNNPLVRLGYPGISGLKTGYTAAAGGCLVATAERHGVRLAVVLLHSADPATQARQLLDRGFRVRH